MNRHPVFLSITLDTNPFISRLQNSMYIFLHTDVITGGHSQHMKREQHPTNAVYLIRERLEQRHSELKPGLETVVMAHEAHSGVMLCAQEPSGIGPKTPSWPQLFPKCGHVYTTN